MIVALRGPNLKLYFEHWPLIWLWPISLVLMQLTLLQFGRFHLTLAVVICHLRQLHLLMMYWDGRPSDLQVSVALAVVSYALLLGLFADDAAEYGQSLAQVLNLAATVLICLNARLERRTEVRRSIGVFCALAAATGMFIIAQALAFNLWRDFQLANVLGPFAPIGPGEVVYEPSPFAALPRANGFYSEP